MVVAPDGYELYYSHWGANTVDRDVFFGPEIALEYFRRQRRVQPPDGWLDEIWGEGGALLDPARKTLLYFGGEDTLFELPRRRVFQRMLEHVWAGWDVRWAQEGLGDFADYLEISRDLVRSHKQPCKLAPIALEPAFFSVLVSYSGRLYPVTQVLPKVLGHGPGLLLSLRRLHGLSRLAPDEFPRSGLHIDEEARCLEFWSAAPVPDLPIRARELWPGWHIAFLRDAAERHLDRLTGLTCPPHDKEQLVADLCAYLTRGASGDNVASVHSFVAAQLADGKTVEVNGYALREDPLEIEEELRRLTVAEAAQAVLADP